MRVHKSFPILLIVIAGLLAVRAVLPYFVERELNRRLAHLGDYHGVIEDVDLHLWRGGYTLHGVRIDKTSGKLPAPLLDAPSIELSVSWRALARGSVVGKAVFESPEITFVASTARSLQQSGSGVNWRERLESLIPARLDEVLIHNGTVVLRNPTSTPKIDLRVTDVEATILNLTNIKGESGSEVATLEAKARIFGQAPFEAKGRFKPVGRPDSFQLSVRALDIDLTQATELTQAYSGLDVASGRGDFVMELKADEGRLHGYAKPLMRDLKLERIDLGDADQLLNPVQLVWKAIAPVVVTLFTNPKKDQFGTRVEISGKLDDKLNFAEAVAGILRNAFVEAYTPDFESLKKSAEPQKKKKD